MVCIIDNLLVSFNTQPPEGGCIFNLISWIADIVSTHSRPKAAVLNLVVMNL